jgi:cytochrome c1
VKFPTIADSDLRAVASYLSGLGKKKQRIRNGYAVFALIQLKDRLFSFFSKVIMHKHITPSDPIVA